jgi:DNA primase
VLALQVERYHQEHLMKSATDSRRNGYRDASVEPAAEQTAAGEGDETVTLQPQTAEANSETETELSAYMRPYEKRVLRYVLKYGMAHLCDMCDEDGNTSPVTVIDYVTDELLADNMEFTNADYASAYNAACRLAEGSWKSDYATYESDARAAQAAAMAASDEEIRRTADSTASITAMSTAAKSRIDSEYEASISHFATVYIERHLGSSADDTLRRLTADLVSERHQLSKIHTKYANIETEQDRLPEIVPRAIYEWKDAILAWRQRAVIAELGHAGDKSADEIRNLMSRSLDLQRLRAELARYLGERTLSPRK